MNDLPDCVKRLQKVIQFRTVSKSLRFETGEHHGLDCLELPETMRQMHSYIKSEFPSVFSSEKTNVELINDGSFLIHVKAANNSQQSVDQQQNQLPFLLVAHMDVVPTKDDEWKHPPFDGVIEDGFLYGRGSLDDKSAVMAILEALSSLMIDESLACTRDFYIALTHDEEVKGSFGAQQVAPRLAEILDGKELEFILDEGLIVLEDFRPGFPPAAMVGICEKGHLDMKLTVKTHGGHSSIPPSETAVTKLCDALSKLNAYKFPVYLYNTPMHQTLLALSPHFPAVQRSMIKSINTTDYVLKKIISRDPITSTLMQTTKVTTLISGGTAANVIPSECWAVVNCRLHPNDTSDSVMEMTRSVVGPDVTVDVVDKCDPPKCSSTDTPAYSSLVNAIKATFANCDPQPIVAPGLLTGQTDSRHFKHLAQNIYRFNPFWLKRADIERIHGHDERIAISNYEQQIEFFKLFLRDAAFSQSFP